MRHKTKLLIMTLKRIEDDSPAGRLSVISLRPAKVGERIRERISRWFKLSAKQPAIGAPLSVASSIGISVPYDVYATLIGTKKQQSISMSASIALIPPLESLGIPSTKEAEDMSV